MEYRLSLMLAVIGTIGAAIILAASGMILPVRALVAGTAMPALLLALHHYYGRTGRSDNLQLLTGSMAILLWCAAAAAIIAHAGMRLRMPLVDNVLAASDRALGIDTTGLVLMTAAHPWLGRVLWIVYLTAVPAVLVSAIALSLMGKKERVWTLIYGYSSGLVLAALMSVMWPAVANFAHARLTPAQIVGLPGGAGTFFLGSVAYFRDGTNPIIDVTRFDGVVTFPSFHTVMALIVAHALRGARFLGPAVYGWAGLLIASTIPIGGHYVVDVLGGATLWLVCLLGARRMGRPAFRSPVYA